VGALGVDVDVPLPDDLDEPTKHFSIRDDRDERGVRHPV